MLNTMKKLFLLVVILFRVTLLSAQEDAVRIKQLLNFDWKFHYGKAEEPYRMDFDDSNWRRLDIPHDFQLELPWDSTARASRGFKRMGEAWYRKHLKVDSAWKGKRILLDFEGIMVYGDVWFNGVKVGGTDYGYLGFEVDITGRINYTGDNVIAVYANTGKAEGSRWYTGGGLFRDVHVLVKDSVAIARNGMFVTTPSVTDHEAEVNIQVEVEGMRGSSQSVAILAKVFSPEGQQVGEVTCQVPTKRKLPTTEVTLPVVQVTEPQRWSCDSPNLYTVEVSLIKDKQVLDKVSENFGIRTIEFSPEFGFKLNGEKLLLKGMAGHLDMGSIGIAAHETAIERQFKQLKAFGFNHIRLAHNPYSKAFLKMADKYGILVVDELFDKWGAFWPARVSFQDLWYKAIPEWVKQDRNHPSVIMWSLGNELQVHEDWTGFQMGDFGVTAYRLLDVLTKRFDPTRKTTVAMFPANANFTRTTDSNFLNEGPAELSLVTDIASYNYLYPYFDDYWKKHPELIIYQSEATTRELGRAYYGMNLDRVVGLAYWGAIQYWGESHGWPRKGWTYSFFDRALQPFPQAYLVKSMFTDEPLVQIGVVDDTPESIEWNAVQVGGLAMSSHWNREKGSKQNIFTYSNAEEV